MGCSSRRCQHRGHQCARSLWCFRPRRTCKCPAGWASHRVGTGEPSEPQPQPVCAAPRQHSCTQRAVRRRTLAKPVAEAPTWEGSVAVGAFWHSCAGSQQSLRVEHPSSQKRHWPVRSADIQRMLGSTLSQQSPGVEQPKDWVATHCIHGGFLARGAEMVGQAPAARGRAARIWRKVGRTSECTART